MVTALVLGNTSFTNLEVPETIDEFGGHQKVVVHNFPGGDREVQTWGWFPPEVISWSGLFWQDGQDANGAQAPDIFQRMQQIQDMIRLAQPVGLSFSEFSYMVLPFKVSFRPKLEKMYQYTIYLIPLNDQNNPVGPPVAPPIQQLSQVANNMGSAPGSPLPAPPPPASNPLVNSSNPNIVQANPVSIPTPVPTPVAAALTSFQQSLRAGIQAALGVISQVNTPAIQQALNVAQSLVAPLSANPDPGLSAFGLATNASLTTIDNMLNPTPEPLAKVNAVNPDLIALAESWYGNADNWVDIAEANGLVVPNPIGIFQSPTNPIIIPVLS